MKRVLGLLLMLVLAAGRVAYAQTSPFGPANVQDFVASGTFGAQGQTINITPNADTVCTVSVQNLGSGPAGSGTLVAEVTLDGVNWQAVTMIGQYGGGSGATTMTTPGIYIGPCGGVLQFRVRSSAWSSGSWFVIARASVAASLSGGGAIAGSGGGGGGGPNVNVHDASGNNINSTSGSLNVFCTTTGGNPCSGGGGSGAPLPGNANTAAGANQSAGVQGYDGTTNMVPIDETANALWVAVKSGSGAPLPGGTSTAAGAAQSVGVQGWDGANMQPVSEIPLSSKNYLAVAAANYDPASALAQSITAAGTNGTNAGAVQGITNGVLVGVSSASGSTFHANIDNFPANAGIGINSAGSAQFVTSCNAFKAIDVSAATTAILIPHVASAAIHICGFNIMANGLTNFKLVNGSGTNCGTSQNEFSGAYNLQAQVGLAVGGGLGEIYSAPLNADVCSTNGSAVQVSGTVYYTAF